MLTFSLAPGHLPSGLRVYAVGDVHGCDDRLAAMHAAIAKDLRERPPAQAGLIHLGDYIDRGPASAAVIARLLDGSPANLAQGGGLHVLNLMGNHEQLMLAALDDDGVDAAMLWLRNGGAASLQSWGIEPTTPPAEWRARLPAAHVSWIRGLRRRVQIGDYLFVHAGVRPGVPLDAQSDDDLVWIREPFLSWSGAFGVVVVHGHTPVKAPVVRSNRIGIDTGAVMGGVLTCAVLEDDRLAFITR